MNRCVKPDKKGEYRYDSDGQRCVSEMLSLTMFDMACLANFAEYIGICKAVAMGFAVMGFIGYFVKLVRLRAIPQLNWGRS